MKKTATADIVIFGGGIAGLWMLNRLRDSGLSAILFESSSLGGGQTHKSQGIIHGGMKYALQGIFTSEASGMADIPMLWRNCLQGKGEIDLTNVPVLSHQHYLWSTHKFTGRLAGFLAGVTLSTKVSQLAKENYPSVFNTTSFKGEIYTLDEIVIDVPHLMRELVKANQDAIFKIDAINEENFKLDASGNLISVTVNLGEKSVEINAQRFIFAAGAGNEIILKKFKSKELGMQRRPLHMVLVKTPFQHPLYAHCIGFGPRPRITITTHQLQDGSHVWYLGGELAEEGINKNSEAQIKATKTELNALFPWLDFSEAEFASFMVDRAEPLQKSGLKPESTFSKKIQNTIIAWPTKLALAPKLAAEILQQLQTDQLSPQLFDIRELRAWPMPPLAMPVWESVFCKSIA